VVAVVEEEPLVLRMPSATFLDDDAFFRLCLANPDLRLERAADGSLIVMAPAGFGSSARNGRIFAQLWVWAQADGTGTLTDSSGAFILPSGATYAPDAAWTRNERVAALPADELERFPHLVPDFVVELRSPSDSLRQLQAKMVEYRDNGVRLGWLLDPASRTVWAYEAGRDEPNVLRDPTHVSADPVLPGFTLDLARVW
jgi:Uma2 family endonuclease